MYKTIIKKVDEMQSKISKSYNQAPNISIITKRDNDYEIMETYYKPNKTARFRVIYSNDYQDYINKIDSIKDNNTHIIIDDIS